MKKLEKTNLDYTELSNYAKKLMKQWSVTLLTVIIAASLVGVLKEAIVIFFAFALMRKFTGGYHMKKFSHCLISSTVMLIVGAMTAKHLNYMGHQFFYGLFTAVSAVALTVFKPNAVKNKQTSESEIEKYNIIAKAELLLYLVIILLLSKTEYQFLISSICIGIAECSVVFLMGKAENLINHTNP